MALQVHEFWDHFVRPSAAGLRLRFALESDCPFVEALVIDPSTVAAVSGTPEAARTALAELWAEGLDSAEMRHLVAVSEGHGRVGYLRLLYPFLEDGCLWLSYFAIVPAWRGQGVGRRVLGLLLDQARSCPLVQRFGMHTLTTNVRAARLYAALGFECVQREPWECADGTVQERLTLVQSVDALPPPQR